MKNKNIANANTFSHFIQFGQFKDSPQALPKDVIPPWFHSIWFGSEFPPKYLFSATKANELARWVASLKKINHTVTQDLSEHDIQFEHVLWTDREDYEHSDKKITDDFCKQNNITLLFVQDFFPDENDELEKALFEIYKKERTLQNFALCSDVMRLIILRRFAGIYVDTDINGLRKIQKEELKTNQYGLKLDILPEHIYKANNDLIGSAYNNPFLDKIIMALIKQYHLPLNELFKDAEITTVFKKTLNYNEEINYLTSPLYLINLFRTFATTGPGLIQSFYAELSKNYQDKNAFKQCWENEMSWHSPSCPFQIRSEQTWLQGEAMTYDHFAIKERYLNFNSREKAKADLTNNILFYYHLEPRTLRLDFYQSNFADFFDQNQNLESEVLNDIIKNQANKLADVQYIGFSFSDTFIKNYQLLLDEKIFPNLKLELYTSELKELAKLAQKGEINLDEIKKINGKAYEAILNIANKNQTQIEKDHCKHRRQSTDKFIVLIEKAIIEKNVERLRFLLNSNEWQVLKSIHADIGTMPELRNDNFSSIFQAIFKSPSSICANINNQLIENKIFFPQQFYESFDNVIESIVSNTALSKKAKLYLLKYDLNTMISTRAITINYDFDVSTLDEKTYLAMRNEIKKLPEYMSYNISLTNDGLLIQPTSFQSYGSTNYDAIFTAIKNKILITDWEEQNALQRFFRRGKQLPNYPKPMQDLLDKIDSYLNDPKKITVEILKSILTVNRPAKPGKKASALYDALEMAKQFNFGTLLDMLPLPSPTMLFFETQPVQTSGMKRNL